VANTIFSKSKVIDYSKVKIIILDYISEITVSFILLYLLLIGFQT